ncbi:hypothetical protein D3C84_759630 [compost metagenome]
MKRAMLKLTGLSVKPATAVKMLNSATQMAIMRGRPMRSARVPRKIAPSIVPSSAEPAMIPALVGSTFMSCMIAGSAAPTTARS